METLLEKVTDLRIASLLSSATEMLYGLGLGEQVVAVSHECDYPPECAGKPRATRSHIDSSATSAAIDEQVKARLAAGLPLYGIDAELLCGLQPDVIVTQAQCDVCAIRYADVVDLVAQQPALKATSIVSLNPGTLGEVLADIERVAAAVGHVDAGRRWVAELTARVDAVRAKTAGLAPHERVRVACIEWIEPVMCAGNWMPELIDIAGGVQPFARTGEHSGYTAWADVVAFDPQAIVVMPCGFDLPRTLLEARRLPAFPGWHELRAVRDGRVYAVDGNAYFNRSGPRLVESLELLAHLLHPQHFTRHPDGWAKLTA